MQFKKNIIKWILFAIIIFNTVPFSLFAIDTVDKDTEKTTTQNNITNEKKKVSDDKTDENSTSENSTNNSFNETLFQNYLNNDMDSIMNFLLKDAYIYNYSEQHRLLLLKKEYENISDIKIIEKIKSDFTTLISENDTNLSNPINAFINMRYKEYIDYLNKSEELNLNTYTFIEFLMQTKDYNEWAIYLTTFKTDILEKFLDTYIFGDNIQSILKYTVSSKDTSKIETVVTELQEIANENGYAVGQLCASIVEYYMVIVNNGFGIAYDGFNAYFIIEKYNFEIADKIRSNVKELNEYDSFKALYNSFSNLSSYDVFMKGDIRRYQNYLNTMNTYNLYYQNNIVNKHAYYQLLTDRIKVENKQLSEQELKTEYTNFVTANNKLDKYYDGIYKVYDKTHSYTDTTISEYATKINAKYKILHPEMSEYVSMTDVKTTDTNEYRVIAIEEKVNIVKIIVIIVTIIIISGLIILFTFKMRRKNQNEYYD